MGKQQRKLLLSGSSLSGRKGESEVPEEAGGGLVTGTKGRRWALKRPVWFGQKGAALWVESALPVQAGSGPPKSPGHWEVTPAWSRRRRYIGRGQCTFSGALPPPAGLHGEVLRIEGTPVGATIGWKGRRACRFSAGAGFRRLARGTVGAPRNYSEVYGRVRGEVARSGRWGPVKRAESSRSKL